MATRTQKAAMRKTADAANSPSKGKAAKAAKPARAAKPKAGTPSPKPAAKGVRKAPAKAAAQPFDPIPEPKPSLGERFWHRIGLGAKAKEERARQQSIEHEAALQLKIEQDRRDRERAEEQERAARKAHAASERKANEKAAREMARIAREEDLRLKREAEEAAARAVEQAAADRKAAAAARREEARVAKLQEAAEAQLAAEEKAARRREAAAARREAARVAREAAKAEAARAAQEAADAQARAAEERAAKRREAAEARREKARQEKLALEAKAQERRLARQRKAEEKAREEELAQLESEAQARRSAPRMDVRIRAKDDEVVEMEEIVEGEAIEVPDDALAPAGAGPEPVFHALEEAAPDHEGADGAPVAPAKANGKAKREAPSDLDAQADRVAEELRSRRSKPITIDADDVPAPTLPVGRKARPDAEPKQVLQLDPAPAARLEASAPRGLSIPEHFLLLALEGVWDERREKATPGNLGGALAGSLLLDLVLHDKVRVQRDRFQLTDAAVDDAAAAVALRLKEVQDRPSLQAMGHLARSLPELLPAYKDRMARRGLLEHRAWRHLGMFYRSQTALIDGDAQERLRNKLARAIAGGGRPDAPTILSLGLLEASGLFGVVVPEGAQAYNRKRLNGLLAGKDVMGYKVDDELKGMQEIAVRTILDNVRTMTVRG